MFIEYQKNRDCLFFLGAGASYSDGVPLQKDIVPEILAPRDEGFKKSKLRKVVSVFISDNFAHCEDSNTYPSLETIFSYLDYFIDNDVALCKSYTLEKLRLLKESLVKLIYFITSKSANPPLTKMERASKGRENDSVYSSLWEQAIETNRNFSIITTNYDNQIDDAFDKWLYPKHGLIDYCIDFLNYTKEKHLIGFDWWVNPREPIPDWKDCNPKPIKLIKLHGSLNWKYCQCCSQAILTPWNKHIDLDTGALPRFNPSWMADIINAELCPRDGYPLSTLIVPPTHSKTLKHPVIQNLIYEAQLEIRSAKKIVFIGYSFPDADIHIKAILAKNLRTDAELVVVNPYLTEEAKQAYRSLSSKVEFVEESFEQALENGLMERVVSNKGESYKFVNGKTHRAVDSHGRIVFFKSLAVRKENDVFIATNTTGNEAYYRVRHRQNGPAMISKDGTRRWIVDGIEKTLEVEESLSSIDSPFKEDGDFELTYIAQKSLKPIL